MKNFKILSVIILIQITNSAYARSNLALQNTNVNTNKIINCYNKNNTNEPRVKVSLLENKVSNISLRLTDSEKRKFKDSFDANNFTFSNELKTETIGKLADDNDSQALMQVIRAKQKTPSKILQNFSLIIHAPQNNRLYANFVLRNAQNTLISQNSEILICEGDVNLMLYTDLIEKE